MYGPTFARKQDNPPWESAIRRLDVKTRIVYDEWSIERAAEARQAAANLAFALELIKQCSVHPRLMRTLTGAIELATQTLRDLTTIPLFGVLDTDGKGESS